MNGLNTSCAVAFDLEGDGDLDLYVGSRSVPGNYGVPTKSFVFENNGRGRFRSIGDSAAPDLHYGMVTDAKMADVTGDAKAELIIIGEWMSPKIYQIEGGKITKVPSNLDDYEGWWYALATDDVDGDGDLDLLLGNRGENFYFTGSKAAPAKLWVRDFDGNGTMEKILTQSIAGQDMPIPMKQELVQQLPGLKKQNLKNSEYADKSIQALFSKDEVKKALTWWSTYFQSAVALNDGNGQFSIQPLPSEVQFSCVNDIHCIDLNDDGKNDLILGGNDSGFIPQFSKLDASFGQVLLNQGDGSYQLLPTGKSGFFVQGDVRNLEAVKTNNGTYILAGVNGQEPKFFKVKK